MGQRADAERPCCIRRGGAAVRESRALCEIVRVNLAHDPEIMRDRIRILMDGAPHTPARYVLYRMRVNRIFGQVRYMSLEGMRRKTDVDAYIREIDTIGAHG